MFWFFLAEEKNCLVAELQERMGEDEFIYWMAYYGIKSQHMEMENMKAKAVLRR